MHTLELWQYTNSYREQPKIDYLNQLVVQISDRESYNGSSVWSSFHNLNQLLQPEEVATPTIKVHTQYLLVQNLCRLLM